MGAYHDACDETKQKTIEVKTAVRWLLAQRGKCCFMKLLFPVSVPTEMCLCARVLVRALTGGSQCKTCFLLWVVGREVLEAVGTGVVCRLLSERETQAHPKRQTQLLELFY